MNRGIFIVLDGNDGSGKATQAKLLAARLAKENVGAELVDFPAYETNVFGALIGECLAGKHGDFVHLSPRIASTLYSCDRLESTPAIRAALAMGKVVIADRFASANQIHQGGKITDDAERATFIEWLDHMEHDVLGVPRPDRIIYLRVPVEVSLKLLSQKRAAKIQGLAAGQKDTVEEDRQYLEQSRAAADWLLTHQPNWTLVDCMDDERMRTPEEIHKDIFAAIEPLL